MDQVSDAQVDRVSGAQREEGISHHHGEDDGGLGGLDGPEQQQAAELDHGEQVHLAEGDVPQVDKVRLVFGRHEEQPQTVVELGSGKQYQYQTQLTPHWLKLN